VDVAPYAYEAHHGSVFEMLDHIAPENYQTRLDIENEIRRFIKVESTVQFMSKNVGRNPETLRFEWKFNYPVLRREYPYLIERIPKKGYPGSVLFIGGAKSDYISKETVGLVYELYPKFELEYVTNAGHWVHADNPNEFFEKISQFLEK
jgi:pimeloyl-ACP methyl ester carboxylesterase